MLSEQTSMYVSSLLCQLKEGIRMRNIALTSCFLLIYTMVCHPSNDHYEALST